MARALVLNATGKVSASVVDALVERGHEVVAASRDPGRAGAPRARVHRVRFDYEDPSTFDAALDGVDRLFWVSPPLVVDGHSLTRPFFERALPRLRKVVLMTASGVDNVAYGDAVPLRRVELDVERSGVPYTHIRPTWFMDNFHTFWVEPIRREGVIPLPAADARTAFVDARDIGAAGAAALERDDTSGRAYTITGSEALTYAEAAAVLGRAVGREIRYVPIDDAAFIAGARAAGIGEVYASMLAQIFGAVRAGAAAEITTGVQDLTGKPPRTLEAYAREYAAAWRA